METKNTGITIEKLSNGYIIGVMGEKDKLFAREIELSDTMVAKNDKEVLEIISETLPKLNARGETELEW